MAPLQQARRFLWAFAASFGLSVLGITAIAVYLNPWGNYGPRGFGYLYNARRAKSEYLASLPVEARPQAVVLGSSNVMRLKPSSIEEKLGKTAFNFGVYWGRADDFICIVRFLVHDLQHRPELLIVGLDTWTFAPRTTPHPVFPGIRRRLLNTPQLVRHHPAVYEPGLTWGRVLDVFSPQQIRHGLRGRRRPGATRGPQAALQDTHLFDPDGTRVSYGAVYGRPGPIFEAVERREYPISQHLRAARATRTLLNLHQYRFDGLDEIRMSYFEAMLDLADDEGIDVVLVLNPVHPEFMKALEDLGQHRHNLEQLHTKAQAWLRAHPSVVAVVDASHLDEIGGDPEGFYDEIHYDTHNADLVLDEVARALGR